MKVKVCGITRRQDACLAAEFGADAVGFVFWPASRRFVAPEAARAIVCTLPPSLLAVGVFVNQTVAEVAAVASQVPLGAIQLHGEEAPEDFAGIGLPLIKAVWANEAAPAFSPASLPPDVLVLVDGAGRAHRGGAGMAADWSRAAAIAACRRTILAGGLTPENVEAAVTAVRPYGVDVSSGVEEQPGIKNAARLRRFIETARRALTERGLS